MSHDERLEELRECERVIAAAQARQLQLLAALATEPAADAKDYAREEVQLALRWSESLTYSRLALAQQLVGPLTATLLALREGRVSLAHAEAVAESTYGKDGQIALAIETAVLSFASEHTLAATRRKISREVERIVPEDLRLEEERAQRRVWIAPETNTMAFLCAVLPAEDAVIVMHALTMLACRKEDGDTRTKDQRMADALVRLAADVLAGGCSHCALPSNPIGPAVSVSVALSTLLGLDEQSGELNGQPIPAELARVLAHDTNGTWRRLITDELGQLLDLGRRSYRPGVALRDYVVARDRTCRFPDCHRRAVNCELDHVTPWQDGGRTSADNLVALCSRHHHLKHEAPGWRVRRASSGEVEWASPTRQVVVAAAATYPIDRTTRIDGSTVNAGRRTAVDVIYLHQRAA